MFSTLARCRYSCHVSLFMLVKKVSSEKPASKLALARCYLLMLADCIMTRVVTFCAHTPAQAPAYTRGHVIMSGHLAVSV